MGSIAGSGRSPGIGNGNSLQYSCLENSMDRGGWRATVYGVAKSRTRLSTHTTLVVTITPILQMRKLKPSEVKQLAHDCFNW